MKGENCIIEDCRTILGPDTLNGDSVKLYRTVLIKDDVEEGEEITKNKEN